MEVKDFGHFLTEKRVELELSQSELANELGYSSQAISNWERGLSYPPMQVWDSLCKIFNLDIEGLLTLKNIPLKNDNKFDRNKFSSYLKEIRDNNALSLHEIAKIFNVNVKTISSWENGYSLPTLKMFLDLARICDLPNRDLYFCSFDPKKIKIKSTLEQDINLEPTLINSKKYTHLGRKVALPILSTLVVMSLITVSVVPFLRKSGEPLVNQDIHENKDQDIKEDLDPTIADNTNNNNNNNNNNDDNNNNEENDENPLEMNGVSTGVFEGELGNFYNHDFHKDEFCVNYYFDDYQSIMHTQFVAKGKKFVVECSKPTNFTIKGIKKTFLGWSLNKDKTIDDLPSFLSGDIDLYAVYEEAKVESGDSYYFDGNRSFVRAPSKNMFIPTAGYYNSIDENGDFNNANLTGGYTLERISSGLVESIAIQKGFMNFSVNDCPNLKTITLPDEIDEIDIQSSNFATLTNESIYVHNSIVLNSTGVENLFIKSDEPTFNISLCNNQNLKYLDLGEVKGIYNLTNDNLNDCYNLEGLILPPNLTTIEGCLHGARLSFIEFPTNFLSFSGPLCDNYEGDVTVVLNKNIEHFDASLFMANKTYHLLYKGGEEEFLSKQVMSEEDMNLEHIDLRFYSETKGNKSWHYNSDGLISTFY